MPMISIFNLGEPGDYRVADGGLFRPAHPARDKKLRIKVPKKDVRDWLEPDEILSLLEAADMIDSPVRPETLRKADEVRRLRDEKKLVIKEIAAELGMSEAGVCWLYERRRARVRSACRAVLATLAASGTRNRRCAICDGATWTPNTTRCGSGDRRPPGR
jgi:DNA-binding transcriptional regulator YiaG